MTSDGSPSESGEPGASGRDVRVISVHVDEVTLSPSVVVRGAADAASTVYRPSAPYVAVPDHPGGTGTVAPSRSGRV
ncbi:hypothetical protein CXF48_07855 [Corynebacterium bovis]|uniref:Uncharacterized protein n=1 Tax=Corynebacterium bovis TaxID=36808 RepID=A0A426PY33_9CORY|nr:hypothetical protein CXF48_07855 [Corynebacterium bovis]